jgi:hypothetical protein
MPTAPPMMPPPPPPVQEKSSKPIIAGVMFLLAFLIALYELPLGIAALSVSAEASSIPMMGGLAAMGALFGILIILGFVGTLLGMIFSFMRKKWILALLGGILALAGLHLLFGLIGLILVAVSKKDFSD